VVFLGALITSTATTLFLLPALYLYFAPAVEAGTVAIEEPVEPADENGNGRPVSDEPTEAGERVP
jgi:hypothetical protein